MITGLLRMDLEGPTWAFKPKKKGHLSALTDGSILFWQSNIVKTAADSWKFNKLI